MLDVERRDSQAMRMQLKVAVEAVQRYGEERASTAPELSRLRIELEAAVRERDCLKDQIHTSQVVTVTFLNTCNFYCVTMGKLMSMVTIYQIFE
jgi:hypothetical protein